MAKPGRHASRRPEAAGLQPSRFSAEAALYPRRSPSGLRLAVFVNY